MDLLELTNLKDDLKKRRFAIYKRKTKDMFIIYGKNFGRPSEEIDTVDTLSEARYLKREYEVGFGANWFIFIKKKRVRVNDDA